MRIVNAPPDDLFQNLAMKKRLLSLLMLSLLGCQNQDLSVHHDADVHQLAERGETHRLLAQITRSGEVDQRDVCYRTPLMFAAQFGRQDTVRELLAAGARVGLHEKGYYTALMLAAGNGHSEVVSMLAEAGAAIDDAEITRGWTALIWAAQRGHRETVALLLELGADATVRDQQGRSARDWALAQGHTSVVAML